MVAVSDVAFGMGLIVLLLVGAVVYVLFGQRDVSAPEFTEHSNLELVTPPPFFDWSVDDDELNADLTPARGRLRPSIDDWVRAELSS